MSPFCNFAFFREERLERRDRAADMRNLRIWDGKHIEVKLKEIIPQVKTIYERLFFFFSKLQIRNILCQKSEMND